MTTALLMTEEGYQERRRCPSVFGDGWARGELPYWRVSRLCDKVRAHRFDRELYLPQEWTTDAARCAAAEVPAEVRFTTKTQLARQMMARVLAAGVPWGWVTGDAVYGNDWRMHAWLEERRLSYVLGVTAQYRIFTGQEREWAAAVVGRVPDAEWNRISCGAGCKDEPMYDQTRLLLREVEEGR